MVTLGPLRVTEHGGEKHPKVFGSLCPTKGASIKKKTFSLVNAMNVSI